MQLPAAITPQAMFFPTLHIQPSHVLHWKQRFCIKIPEEILAKEQDNFCNENMRQVKTQKSRKSTETRSGSALVL